MATFKITHTEGVHMIEAQLENEMIRAESGALYYTIGPIRIDAPLPGPRGILAGLLSGEKFIRPKYTGTGTVFLEPSLGGFHILEVEKEPWIIAPGGYWASEGNVTLTVKRESFWTSYWAGEGIIFYQTEVKGKGKVVIASPGDVQEVTLDNGKLVDENKVVLARTAGISLKIRRPTVKRAHHYWSGEKFARIYEGTGKLLLCPVPYWRNRSAIEKQKEEQGQA